MIPEFEVIVRGQRFLLDKEQIEFDAPNFFSNCFLTGFQEAQARTVTLNRNPALFAIIVDYLSGYELFPLSKDAFPSTMSPEAAVRNLEADARFFGLSKLQTLLRRYEFIQQGIPSSIAAFGMADFLIPFEDVIAGHLPERVGYRAEGLCVDLGEGQWVYALVHARNMACKLILEAFWGPDIVDNPPERLLQPILHVNKIQAGLLKQQDQRYRLEDGLWAFALGRDLQQYQWRGETYYASGKPDLEPRIEINGVVGDIHASLHWIGISPENLKTQLDPDVRAFLKLFGDIQRSHDSLNDGESPYFGHLRRSEFIADSLIFAIRGIANQEGGGVLWPQILNVTGRTVAASLTGS